MSCTSLCIGTRRTSTSGSRPSSPSNRARRSIDPPVRSLQDFHLLSRFLLRSAALESSRLATFQQRLQACARESCIFITDSLAGAGTDGFCLPTRRITPAVGKIRSEPRVVVAHKSSHPQGHVTLQVTRLTSRPSQGREAKSRTNNAFSRRRSRLCTNTVFLLCVAPPLLTPNRRQPARVARSLGSASAAVSCRWRVM